MAVAVIGAGPAGCAAAYVLARRGLDPLLIEAQDRVGGRSRTVKEDGFVIDTGALFLMPSYRHVLALIHELGHADELVAFSREIGLHDGDRLAILRFDSLASYFSLPFLRPADKVCLGGRSLVSAIATGADLFDSRDFVESDGQLETWARSAVGDRAYDYVIRPIVESVWGVDEVAAPLWPALVRAAAHRPVRMLCLASGIGSLCEWLADGLRARCGTTVRAVRTSSDGVRVETTGGDAIECEAAIVATDAHTAAALLGLGFPASLGRIRYGASIHVALAYTADPWPHFPGWALIPVGKGQRNVVAVGFSSGRAPGLTPAGGQVVSVYFGDRGFATVSEQDAPAHAIETLTRLLGPAAAEPAFTRTYRRPLAFPLPRADNYAHVQRAQRALPARIALAGDYFAPGGIETAVASGERAAHALAERT